MKNTVFLLFLAIAFTHTFANSADSRPSAHPRIYVTPDKKDAFKGKLQSAAWAKDSYDNLKANVEPYVDRHQTDPEWIISRMQMYWDTHYERVYVKGNAFLYGKGRAPAPTVKFAGHRDGATDYLMPSLEETQPYMDEKGMYLQNRKKEGRPWEWVHPSKTGRMIGPMNDRILALAADAAFLYWFTGEEKYAVFASDIFLTYVRGMHYRREPFALEDYSNSHLMGLATFEVILDGLIPYLALCYDFMHDRLRAEEEMITGVLKRFAEQQILYGVPDNNWNIFQARHIAYIALALEDDGYYADGRGQQYYLNEILNHTTIRQFALKEMVGESFDAQTGLWHESATYSMSVCNDLLEIVSLIDNASGGEVHMLDTFPVIRKAVPATVQYLFPNGRVTAFGDARYATLRPQPFEMLIALYRKYGEKERETELARVLRRMMLDGVYDRGQGRSMFSLFFYVDEPAPVPPAEATYSHLLSDTYYAPNVSWLMQRNGRDSRDAMALTLTGSYGNHAHANGISLEMYGKGLMLAPESSYGETYGTRDNQEYYARFPAHNTVAVDGISDYGMMRSDYPYRLLSCYPAHGGSLRPSERVTFARVSLTEPKTDARQERLTGIVRTGETAAYVVDIFRSARNDGRDVKHEYFYHSIGQAIDLAGRDGQSLTLAPATRELSSQAGDMKGYDYFSDKKSVATAGDFTARFRIGLQQSPDVSVLLWMKGYEGRTVFTAVAPKSNAFVKGSIPDELLDAPLPTLIVRQQGEAWNRPFVAIYHPCTEDGGASVRNVEYFGQPEGSFTGIKVQTATGTDYIFNRPGEGPEMRHLDMRFDGAYAIAGETADGRLSSLFLGEGRLLEKGAWRIRSESPGAQVSLFRNGDKAFDVTASTDIRLEMPAPANGLPPTVTVAGKPDETLLNAVSRQGNSYSIVLSAGCYVITADYSL